ncbi:MAG: DUF348 domain-containing protein [Angelakisella sp.]|jgi:uncharacterized protein YabE (DUF348 family)/3D (Asp-Asp-Asp) domain-containing protein|nr:DUF348 domain-containing protein [Angelakisella sp.]
MTAAMQKNLVPFLLRAAEGVVRCVFSSATLAGIAAVALSAVIFTVNYLNHVVYIIDGDSATVTVTREQDHMKILANEEIRVTAKDIVEYTQADGERFGQITIQHPFQVTLAVDGQQEEFDVMEGDTVEEMLAAHGVELRSADKITHPRATSLMPGDDVSIVRVDSRRVENEVVIPHKTEEKHTSVIKNGTTRTLQYGADGLKKETWEEVLEDGEVVDRYIVREDILKYPTTAQVLVGDGSAISNFDFSAQYPLDANGDPVNYISVLRNQKATGYHRSGKAWGSGYWTTKGQYGETYCQAGTVAVVRLDEMPYGTKLYIKTPDNKFIYGYSVVNDTGEFAYNGVTVDLFYETYTESVLNGARFVDIYILEIPGR